tara:strand:+ start:474 stop:1025 length:552 start_codon:yes stop_codon:yes gene_type:complete
MASKIKVDQIQTGDGTGTIALQNQLSGMTTASLPTTLLASQMPTGSTIQVVQTVFTTFTQITNTSSYVATGLSGSITPQFSNSKILVNISHNINTNRVAAQAIQCRLQRDSTVIRAYDQVCTSSDSNTGGMYSLVFLDSPNTTSSIAYTTLMKGTSSDYFRINNYNSSSGDGCSTITLMEIKV